MIYLLTAGLFASLGYFVASWFITRSLADDIARLDLERNSIERQKQMIDAFLDGVADGKRFAWDLGGHKRLPRVLS